MRHTRLVSLILTAVLCLTSGFAATSSAVAAGVQPLERAHAHNDYEHPRPLADALDHGFT